MAGKPWYTNGEVEIQIDITKGDVIPDGFVHGRRKKTEKEIQSQVSKFRDTISKKSQEEIDEENRRRSESLVKSHQNETEERKQEIIKKRKETNSLKSKEEIELWKANISASTMGKNQGNTPWNKGLTEDTDERVANIAIKVSETNKENSRKILDENPEYYHQWRDTVAETMKQNGSYGKSKQEDDYYETLCEQYGKSDVVRQYKDERYPFSCDFYIPSEDLFIELNRCWTHGGRPYDPNDEDCQKQLELWQEKAKTSDFYKNAIYTWSDLDVRKATTARNKNLNYLTIY